MANVPTIDQLNKFTDAEFNSFISNLFEPCPILITPLLKLKPFTSYEDLLSKVSQVIFSLSEEGQIEIINAHPRLGAPKESLSEHSFKEQGYANAPQETPEQLAIRKELNDLNDAYEKQFGFKFMIFVNGRNFQQIIPVLKERLARNDRKADQKSALQDFVLIANSRLNKLQGKL
jgi:2-oxo-4-hydroxy-4-carboxy--5-ureidoimidazoline (OHCU) decarboxylase